MFRLRARTRIIITAVVVAVSLVVLLLDGSRPGAQVAERRPVGAAPAAARRTHIVTYVHDGDTIEVEGIGKVRLLGIDAMDAYDGEKAGRQARQYGMSVEQVRHWAEQGVVFARNRLDGRPVELHYGGDVVDDYGRTLAYVHVLGDGKDAADFNRLMLEAGLAAAYRRYGHPRRDDYLEAEAKARASEAGLWRDARARP